MQCEYICQECGHEGRILDLAYWTDQTYRCPKCFGVVSLESYHRTAYTIARPSSCKRIATIIVDGLYIAGVQRHCIQLAKVFRKFDLQVMVIAIEGGGSWYEKFIDIADYLFVPAKTSPSWAEIEAAFGSSVFDRIELCSCHLIIPILWGIQEIPTHIKLFAHIHSEPSEHEIIPPLFFEQLSIRAKRIFFPTLQTLNVYKSLSTVGLNKFHVLPNGFFEPALEQQDDLKNDGTIRIAVVSRIDCDKFAFSLFENTLKVMIDRGLLFKIIVAGNGDSMSTLLDIVDRLHTGSCIKILGFLDDPTSLYQWSDLVFLPSKRESMPYVMLESVRFQKPIVLPMLGVLLDNIPNTGVFSFAPNNENDAVDKIVLAKKFALDKDNKKRMSMAYMNWSREWIEEVSSAYGLR